jgi:hypothetical protein
MGRFGKGRVKGDLWSRTTFRPSCGARAKVTPDGVCAEQFVGGVAINRSPRRGFVRHARGRGSPTRPSRRRWGVSLRAQGQRPSAATVNLRGQENALDPWFRGQSDVNLAATIFAHSGSTRQPIRSPLEKLMRKMPVETPKKAPAPNRRPRFPLGSLVGFDCPFCVPPPSPAAVGESRR